VLADDRVTTEPGWLRFARLAFGLLVLVAIGYQLWVSAGTGRLDLVNFFSYFTILSNLLGAAVFLIGAARLGPTRAGSWDLLRGQAVVVLTVTLVVFALLLADTDVDVTNAWVDTVLHRLFPVVVIADWLLDPPRVRVSVRSSLVWLAAPLAWTAYTLIRGALVGWYPYPFLDPAEGGYGPVAVVIVGILVFGVVVCAAVAFLGNAADRRRRT
jgi:hypothetical protein